ncbi:MAG: GTPase Era [Acidimicrobiia bacterium]
MHRSGFVTLVGRPNVGKSTLLNRLVGSKVSIVSNRPQTTRTEIRGVLTRPGSQVVFLDTPGIHKPRTQLGERTNARALATLAEVDVVVMVVEADAPIGRGDEFVARLVHRVETPSILVVNKVDRTGRAGVAERLATAEARLGEFAAYVPISARTGDGVDALLAEIDARLPDGPRYYPEGVVTDQPETVLAAEMVREQLLRVARDELPHSISVRAEELEAADGRVAGDETPLRLRAVVAVERESQKGMVIGKQGAVLKEAGTNARLALEALLGRRVYLETTVTVERDWQRRSHMLDRFGY